MGKLFSDFSFCAFVAHQFTFVFFFSFQELEVALLAYEELARVAVFLEQARLDEVTYESASSSYALRYQEIEEQAVYWLLCQLKKFIHEMGEDQVNVMVTRDIMAIQLRTASSRITRYNRDFIVQRDGTKIIENILRRFRIQKVRLEGQMATASEASGASASSASANVDVETEVVAENS